MDCYNQSSGIFFVVFVKNGVDKFVCRYLFVYLQLRMILRHYSPNNKNRIRYDRREKETTRRAVG